MSNPTVSVILPVYNGEQYLRFAVESVLNQTFQDFEVIMIDDGSVDSTPAIAREYRDRVRYVRQDNTGVAGAFNHGLRLAAGRYVSWLSHDDMFLPTKLEKQISAVGQVDAPCVCYTDIQMIDSHGNVVAEHRLPQYGCQDALRYVLTGGPICMASYSVLYDRRCIGEVGMYSETWRYAQDVDMLSKFARHFPLVRVPEMLMQVREHENRAVNSKAWEREVVRYFSERLDSISVEELFPELGSAATGRERAEAFLWLADSFAGHPLPAYRKIARGQYLKALSASRAILPLLFKHYFASIFRRHPQLYKFGLRSAFARRFSSPRR